MEKNENIKGMEEILKKKLEIPIYQRNYVWENEEIGDFLEDIKRLYTRNEKKNHFMGQFVFHDEGNNKLNVIDGQQRIITITILINNIKVKAETMRDALDNILKNKEGYKRIKSVLKNVERHSSELIGDDVDGYHLVMNSKEDFLCKILDKNVKKDEYKDDLHYARIKKCDDKMQKFVNDYICPNMNVESDDPSIWLENVQNLKKMLEIVQNRLTCIYIITDELDDAFEIFETLNARGKSLGTADLLKNYVLAKSNDNIDTINKSWNNMVDKLKQSDVTSFVRCFWNSKFDLARKKELYREFTKKYKDYEDIKELLEQLNDNAEVYASLENPYNDDSCFESDELKRSLYNLNSMNAKTFYPIILALYSRQYKEEFIQKIVKAIEVYIFRNGTICKNNPNGNETEFAQIAKNISCKERILENTKDIIQAILESDVDDRTFIKDFSNKIIKDSKIIKYIYGEFEKRLVGDRELIIDEKKVHVEHIMPKNFEKWEKNGIKKPEDFDRFLWRIGNQTLFLGVWNQSISNNLFEDKQKKYQDSSINLTKKLANEKKYKYWNEDTIIKRQKVLARYANRIWNKNKIDLE